MAVSCTCGSGRADGRLREVGFRHVLILRDSTRVSPGPLRLQTVPAVRFAGEVLNSRLELLEFAE